MEKKKIEVIDKYINSFGTIGSGVAIWSLSALNVFLGGVSVSSISGIVIGSIVSGIGGILAMKKSYEIGEEDISIANLRKMSNDDFEYHIDTLELSELYKLKTLLSGRDMSLPLDIKIEKGQTFQKRK